MKDNVAGVEAIVLTQDESSKCSVCFSLRRESGSEIVWLNALYREPRTEQKQVWVVSCLCMVCLLFPGGA